MPKDIQTTTDPNTDAAMAQIKATIEAPVVTTDPMQRGAEALREIDETAQRVWKAKPPKEMLGELNGYLVNGKVAIVHQLPSGKFVLYKRVSLAELSEDGQ